MKIVDTKFEQNNNEIRVTLFFDNGMRYIERNKNEVMRIFKTRDELVDRCIQNYKQKYETNNTI